MKKIYLQIVLLTIFIFIVIMVINYYAKRETFKTQNRMCVVYNYYEKDDTYKDNFYYFLNNGILDEIDYYIIVNGNCSLKIPNEDNIFTYYRENKGYDFGAFSYIVNNKLTTMYDYYFFLNTSVRGPYLKNKNKKWYDYFIPLFNENVHLVGTSINVCTNENFCLHDKKYKKKINPHVQSMFFCIDQKYFLELKKEDFFNEVEINEMNFTDIIRNKEVKLSQIAIEKGYNINCILSKYKNKDYVNMRNDINPTSIDGDPYFKNSYFSETIDPYEVIFYKTNRI